MSSLTSWFDISELFTSSPSPSSSSPSLSTSNCGSCSLFIRLRGFGVGPFEDDCRIGVQRSVCQKGNMLLW